MGVERPGTSACKYVRLLVWFTMHSVSGAAGECIGYDRWLKTNTVKRRTHSLFRQGLLLYHHLPNSPDDRIRPLMEKFGSMLAEQRVFKEVFGVI